MEVCWSCRSWFFNVFPKAGKAIYDFAGKTLTNLFHGVYDQQINKNKAGKVIVVFFVIVGAITIIVSGVTTFNNLDNLTKQIVKKEEKIKKPEVKIKKEVKKPKLKTEPKKKVKKEIKKKEKVTELILPDLNLKTETVLNLFEDVEYDLNTVRYEKSKTDLFYSIS